MSPVTTALLAVACLSVSHPAVAMNSRAPTSAAAAVAPADIVMTYEVEGMKCDGCSQAIVAKVKKVEGVVECTVDRTAKLATITVKDESSRSKVEEAITKLGYKITKKS